MPKRSLDLGKYDGHAMPTDKVQRKTERSHEENQERAYIAASRRADRSLEARVQSARMASEIHKKRTGKGFRITEEIVSKEEMYEEEEDEFPRSYRLLGPHLQTPSAELNQRVESYLSNRMAMSALLARTNEDWKANEINRLFAQSFPFAGQHAQQLSQRFSAPEQTGQMNQSEAMPQSPTTPSFQPVNYRQNSANPHKRSMSSVAPSEPDNMAHLSPAAMTPGSSSNSGTPQTWSTPQLSHAPPPIAFNSAESAFTTELPAEAKMLLGAPLDVTSEFTQNFYGQEWMNQGQMWNVSETPRATKGEPSEQESYPDIFTSDPTQSLNWDSTTQAVHMDDQSWNAFIDEGAWEKDHQQHQM